MFSCIGHLYFHYLAAMYFTIIVALEKDWNSSFSELAILWTPAAVLVGIGALPAGAISDYIRAERMIALMFLGMGGASFAAAFVSQNFILLAGLLAIIGLFGSIYHPVGIPWIMRDGVKNKGIWLAINNSFGGLGAAFAGGFSGWLISISNWSAAFMVPGILGIGCAVWMVLCMWVNVRRKDASDVNPVQAGSYAEPEAEAHQTRAGSGLPVDKGDWFSFGFLLLPMLAAALIYHGMQSVLPKLLETSAPLITGNDIERIGYFVAIIYTGAAIMQFVGGYLADRYSLRLVYAFSFVMIVPLTGFLGAITELNIVATAFLLACVNTGLSPSENLLFSAYAPKRKQGLAFGIKFVLGFGAAPIAVALSAAVFNYFGDFVWLFAGLSCFAFVGLAVCLRLPDPFLAQAKDSVRDT